MKIIVKLVLLAGQLLLLSSCAWLNDMLPPLEEELPRNAVSKPDKVAAPSPESVAAPAAARVPSLSFKLDPSQNVTIDQLKVSYSMIAVADEDGYFLRLALVFTNLGDQALTLSPNAILRDARGTAVSAFSKRAFLRLPARRKDSANPDAIDLLISDSSDGHTTTRDRGEWAESYWLKNRLRIPPQGIALGGMVFHADKLILPMKLSVEIGGQDFEFAANDSVPVLNRKHKDQNRLFDVLVSVASSKSGITAYAVPASIRKNGEHVEMWSLFDFRQAETSSSGQTYLSARSLNEYECSAARSRLLEFSWHSENMGGGEMVFSNSDPQDWATIAPDSLEGFIWKYACTNQQDR